MRNFLLFVLIVMFIPTQSSFAAITNYTNKSAWQNAVQQTFITIDFTGYGHFTPLNSQYESLGVLFTDGDDLFRHDSDFLNDGHGMYANWWSSIVEFSKPQRAFAVQHLASTRFELYLHGASIGLSQQFIQPGAHQFSGIVSTQPFDKVRIYSPTGSSTNVDDMHFSTVPAPGALALLGITGLMRRRSRRRA